MTTTERTPLMESAPADTGGASTKGAFLFCSMYNRLPSQFEPPSELGPMSCAGVYAVLSRSHPNGAEHLLYIGSSSNMSKRLLLPTHVYLRSYERLHGNVYTRCFPTSSYVYWERRMIKALRPLLNIQHNG